MKTSLALFFSLLLLCSSIAQDEKPAPPPQDQVILTVDGTPIMRSAVGDQIARNYGQRLSQFPPEQAQAMLQQIQKGVINEMIGKVLLVNAAQRDGLKVEAAELEEAMTEVANQNLPGSSVEDFLKEARISKDRFTKDVRENLLIMKLADKEMADVPKPTAEEIAAFFEENKAEMKQAESVRARHILIKTEGITDPAALDSKKAEAEKIRQELLKDPKLDFGTVAAQKSEGPSGPRGGDLGQFGRGDMVPPFEEAAFTQKIGEVGEVVKTNFGFHIIKVEERTEAKEFTLEEISPRIAQHLSQARKSQHMKDLVDELRAAADIVQPGAEKPAKS
ncbi:MAG: peptidylprolyl isomerase [Verrucomicrobiota bacterium]